MTVLTMSENQKPSVPFFAGSPADDPRPLVLIVEDNQDSRLMLKCLLEMWNYRVIEAADGIEAISIAKMMSPALILMDARLPVIDGFETTRQIREAELISRVPIIFLSACAETVYRRAALAVGADEYLSKPLDFEQLEEILGKYITLRQADSRGNP